MKFLKQLILLPALLLAFSFTAEAQIAVKGETVYTMAGQPISNGVVLIKDGKIERVGSEISIPSSYEV